MRKKKALSSKEFFNLLRTRTSKNAKKMDEAIWERSSCEMTVVVCDSSGFSKKTHRYGIIHFLDNFTKCHDEFEKTIKKYGGRTISTKADNFISIFKKTEDAVKFSVKMIEYLNKRNKRVSDIKQFNLCAGIHYGKFLKFTDDIYGAAVNVAFKLGEDIAGKNDIFLTHDANDRVKAEIKTKYVKTVKIGGKSFKLYRPI